MIFNPVSYHTYTSLKSQYVTCQLFSWQDNMCKPELEVRRLLRKQDFAVEPSDPQLNRPWYLLGSVSVWKVYVDNENTDLGIDKIIKWALSIMYKIIHWYLWMKNLIRNVMSKCSASHKPFESFESFEVLSKQLRLNNSDYKAI